MIAAVVVGIAGLSGFGRMARAETPHDNPGSEGRYDPGRCVHRAIAAGHRSPQCNVDNSLFSNSLSVGSRCRTACPGAGGYTSPYAAPSVIPSLADRNEHLRQAASHLQAAGLTSLADHVRSLAVVPSSNTPGSPQAAGQDPRQILAVRVLEIDADKLRRWAWAWRPVALQGQGNVVTVVRTNPALPERIAALRKDCLAQVLAEPNLVTLNNRPAFFQLGGQIAIPSAEGQQSGTKPEYKNIGTQIDFVPNLLGNGRLRLELHYQCSELDRTHTATVRGLPSPGIRTLEVETGVEMELGQTLATGGRRRQRGPIPRPCTA